MGVAAAYDARGGAARVQLHPHGLVDYIMEVLRVRELLRAVDIPERHRTNDAVHETEDVVLQEHLFPSGAAQSTDEFVHL